jgi:hypothetical protein
LSFPNNFCFLFFSAYFTPQVEPALFSFSPKDFSSQIFKAMGISDKMKNTKVDELNGTLTERFFAPYPFIPLTESSFKKFLEKYHKERESGENLKPVFEEDTVVGSEQGKTLSGCLLSVF